MEGHIRLAGNHEIYVPPKNSRERRFMEDRCQRFLLERFAPGSYVGEDNCSEILEALYGLYSTESRAALSVYPEWSFYQLLFRLYQGWTFLWDQWQSQALVGDLLELFDDRGIVHRRIWKYLLEQSVLVDFIETQPTSTKELYDTIDRAFFATEELFWVVYHYFLLRNFDQDAFTVTIYPEHIEVPGQAGRAFLLASSPEVAGQMRDFGARYREFEGWSKDQWPQLYNNKVIWDQANAYVQRAFGFRLADVIELLSNVKPQQPTHPDLVEPVDACELENALARELGVTPENTAHFLRGLTVRREKVACSRPRPEKAGGPTAQDRLLYRPILEWQIDNQRYFLFSPETLTESFSMLLSHCVPHGKLPDEWLDTPMKEFQEVERARNSRALENAVAEALRNLGYAVGERLDRWRERGREIVAEPGEIDVAAIDSQYHVLYLIECKALSLRADITGWSRDWNALSEERGYMESLMQKLEWVQSHTVSVKKRIAQLSGKAIPDGKLEIRPLFVTQYPTFVSQTCPTPVLTLPEFANGLRNARALGSELVF